MSRGDESGLHFIIIGGSIAGLASAIALRASGHNVLVLEQERQLGGSDSVPSGVARVPPNGSKILFDWGLGPEVIENTIVSEGFMVYKYTGGHGPGLDCVGLNRWDPEFLTEARGDFRIFRHRDLLHILYDAAIRPPTPNDASKLSPKVTVLFGAEVVHIDMDLCSVSLRSGDIHIGDAVIGADGAGGIVRQSLMREQLEDPTATVDKYDLPTGLSVCSANISKVDGLTVPEFAKFYQSPHSNLGTVCVGSNRGALTSILGKSTELALSVYTPDCSDRGGWTRVADKKMSDVIGPCDIPFQNLAAYAGPSVCIQIKDHHELESWVSESGRVVVLGDAAHPFPPAAMNCYAIALEDEHRRDRCFRIRNADKHYITTLTLPDGEVQESRDALMRANQAAGRNVMDAPESSLQDIIDEMRMVFGYEPTDDADEWWMSWGRLRDASEA
ncbi:FAD-binding-3 domain-containing protein [Mycena venus]|uniref:FAD-binding-3 domain-containing protein n=1 Tax=Mycena venus TaxID=2733690 RepID=A0A8H6WYF4_9AGAR|nr:FAD-binding-3 domain-containing protein [Mycena venus]